LDSGGQLRATAETRRQNRGGSHSPNWKPAAGGRCEPSHHHHHHQHHHKSSSLGSPECLERLIQASVSSGGEAQRAMGASCPLVANHDQDVPSLGMHKLDVELRRGHNLAVRDRGGTSDPYVKFKLSGKEVFRSKTIHKNLNPVWDEKTTLILDSLSEPLYIKVYDYDFGLQDDFMGSAYLPLDSLEQQRTVLQQQSMRLSEVHRKAQLWRGITISKTLSPQWREQFDLHLYEETGGVLEMSVWDRDTGRRDDFIGRCQLDLSTLAKEHTHHLELALETCPGTLVLLVTLTASLHLSIAELSITPLDDPQERAQITQHYSDPFCVVELNNDRLQTHTVYKNLNPEWNKVFTFNVKDIHAVLEVTVLDEDRDRSADFLGKVAIPLLYVRNGEQKAYILKNKHLTGPMKGVVYLEIDVIYNTLLQQNYNRVRRCVMVLINIGTYVNSCFEWESAQRSIISLVVFVLVDSERKGFMDKLYAIQDVTVNWTVPFLSWLAVTALCVAMALLYFLPLRYLFLAWGVNKFTKKLRNPYLINNNELLDFLSRVPSDVQVVQYRELKVDPGQSPNKRKKNNPG
ncbi:hypothetical protein CRUP_026107, partial [Coryphaenoides rupestris]